jgi:intracellular sulfur oxidation DsrE/DsrF family protein
MTTRRDFLGASGAVLAAPLFAPARFNAALEAQYRHRQVYGMHRAEGGAAFAQMKNALNAYEYELGEGPGTMHVAAVFYGTAVALGLDDATWDAYGLVAAQQMRGDGVGQAPQDGNPFRAARGTFDPAARYGDARHPSNDDSIEGLAKRGATFAVCNNALRGLATFLAMNGKAAGRAPVEKVLADLQSHLLPAAILVPAGVAALNAAQEAKFTYVAAS